MTPFHCHAFARTQVYAKSLCPFVALLGVIILAACAGPTPEPPTVSPALPSPVTRLATSTPAPEPTPRTLPAPTTTLEPTATLAPTATLEPASDLLVDIPGLEEVKARLGYALFPEYLPAGFEASNVGASGERATLRFGDPTERLIVAYPVTFTPDESPLMIQIGMVRPLDALVEVDVGDEKAYLMRGGWSDATIIKGPSINPSDAEWEYDKSLSLFFSYHGSDGSLIGVAVQALANPSEWTNLEEMVRIAESLTLAD